MQAQKTGNKAQGARPDHEVVIDFHYKVEALLKQNKWVTYYAKGISFSFPQNRCAGTDEEGS